MHVPEHVVSAFLQRIDAEFDLLVIQLVVFIPKSFDFDKTFHEPCDKMQISRIGE